MEFFGLFILSFFALYGILSFVEKMILTYTSRGINGEIIYCIKMKGHIENAEDILRRISNKMKWLHGSENKSIICIDEGMDEETRYICEKYADDNSFIKIVFSRR